MLSQRFQFTLSCIDMTSYVAIPVSDENETRRQCEDNDFLKKCPLANRRLGVILHPREAKERGINFDDVAGFTVLDVPDGQFIPADRSMYDQLLERASRLPELERLNEALMAKLRAMKKQQATQTTSSSTAHLATATHADAEKRDEMIVREQHRNGLETQPLLTEIVSLRSEVADLMKRNSALADEVAAFKTKVATSSVLP